MVVALPAPVFSKINSKPAQTGFGSSVTYAFDWRSGGRGFDPATYFVEYL